MKRLAIVLVLFIFYQVNILACDICKANQPEILQDITHGTGPEGNTDYVIIWLAVIIVGITFLLSARYLIFPKKHDSSHIKFIPFNEQK